MRARLLIVAGLCATVSLTGCTASSSGPGARSATPPPTATASSLTPTPTPSPVPMTSAAKPKPTRSAIKPAPASKPKPTSTATSRAAAGTGPVIVIDPGHSPSIHAIDPTTGLDVTDYANEPEMRDVYAVALLVKAKLVASGYRVVMTKTSVDDRVTLGQRAAIANRAHAALAISIHDQAGSNGGIGFRSGNNIVYYQSVGTYRSTPAGKKVYFTNAALAKTSKRYAEVFRDERARIEGTHVNLQSSTGYDLGSRGLAGGDIWLVQLLSKVPWVYNESGGNSSGQSGLDGADKQTYADALVASIEKCVPVR